MQLNILHKFTLFSVLVTLGIAAAMGLLVSAVLNSNLLSDEAQTTADAVRAVTNVDLPPAEFEEAVRKGDDEKFEHVWQHLREMPTVFRMKVYGQSGRIVWSDEPRLIGRLYADNEELREALGGRVAVELGKLKAEHEYEKSLVPEGEILEVYVPLARPRGGAVYAVLELYKHPEAFLAGKRFWLRIIWGAAFIGGLALYFSLSGLFRNALREQRQLHDLERQRAAMDFEMQEAHAIQERLLPATLPEIPGYTLSVFHQSCREIGGDYYDLFELADGSLAVMVADNEGKGIPGALLMARTQSLLRGQMDGALSPSAAVGVVSRALAAGPEPPGFVTLFLARLHPADARLDYCDAGHCPALLLRRGEVIQLDVGGLPLAVELEERYEEASVQLQPGDLLLLYTDGVTEALNPKDDIFGMERLRDLLRHSKSQTAEEVVAEVNAAIAQFREGCKQSDDMVILCLGVGEAQKA